MNSALYQKTINPGLGEPALPLHLYTAKYMPAGFGGTCVGDCANDTAAYIKSLSATKWCPSSSSSSSSSTGGMTFINTAAPAMRRLNRTEYDNVMRDLLGTQQRIASTKFPLEKHGPDLLFTKDGTDRNTLEEEVLNYVDAAERLVEEALTANIPDLACAVQNEACVSNIITQMGKRAWRRPVTAAEQLDLLNLYRGALTKGAPFRQSLATVLNAILVSPNFIFVPEIDANSGSKRALNAHELAARLSFFIWSSIPDQQLMAAADNNSLLNDVTLRAQVKRMLQDAKAENLLNDFAKQWLKYSREYSKSEPNTILFPQYSEALHASMVEETRLFVRDLIFNNQPTANLVTANYSFLDGRLKTFYNTNFGIDPIPPAAILPIPVQAESYNNALDTTVANQGGAAGFTLSVDVQPTTDAGGGFNVGYIAAGEWLEYSVTVPADGEYELAVRVAALNAGGGFKLTAGIGPNIISTAPVTVAATGGYQAWTTLEKIKLGKLYAGINTVRIDMTGANFNLNWFRLNFVGVPVNNQFEKVSWGTTPRFGLLGHASILTASSDNMATIPVRRGVWVLNSLLCDAPPPPPFTPPPIEEDGRDVTPVSTRERFEKKHRLPECVNCHNFIDPIGFGLENYGPIGEWRDEEVRGYYDEGPNKTFIKIGPWEIDSSGELPDGGAFDGPQELSQILGSSSLVPMCVAKHLATYAIGRNVVAYAPGRVEQADFGLVNSIYQKTKANGNRFQDMLEEVVMSDAFRQRTSAQ